MNFSKSKYCSFIQCPKIIWLQTYKPEEYFIDDYTKSRMEAGSEIGDIAMGIFGDYVDVTTYTNEKLDLKEMINKTPAMIKSNQNIICEASFSVDGLYCAVDILKKEHNGYSIYEVKSSTDYHHYEYIIDVAYQKYVLEKCGINIVSTNLVTINSNYVFNGTLELNKLFNINNVDDLVNQELKDVEDNLKIAKEILESQTEPNIDLSVKCNSPHLCGFWKYCSKHLPKPSVFDLYKTNFDKKIDYYKNNIISFQDLKNTGHFIGAIQNMQIEHSTQDLPDQVDIKGIKKFLNTLTYPLYFLDFETMQPVIPEIVGTRPYQQIPFQYSLHYIENENGEVQHKEFLAESGTDPRRAIAESLCKDIPEDACVLAYNKGFECGRINELANAFPDLRNHLMNIHFNMKDLIDPFRAGHYYNKAMGGSFSIKSVLPALFPNDPELDYHNLEQVHNGGEAMSIFPRIKDMSKEEQEIARKNLLAYCKLDTLAMVKVWQKLIEVSK